MQLLTFISFAVLAQATAAPVAEPTAPPAVQAPAAAVAAPSSGVVRVPAGTPVEVELVESLSSKTSKLGDHFAIRVAQPIAIEGAPVLAAGATGQGEVIDVAQAGLVGGRGKLIISARSLDLNGRPVQVRGMTLMVAGKGRVGLAHGVSFIPYVGLASIFIKGGEIEIPAGTHAIVHVAQDVELPATPSTETPGPK
jgi:hypothetical protein